MENFGNQEIVNSSPTTQEAVINEEEIASSLQPRKPRQKLQWLPDWKKLEGYPDPKTNVSRDQWAWEFLRRNPRYQLLYRIGRRHRESWYKQFPDSEKFSRYFKCRPKVNKGESYRQYITRCESTNVVPTITPKRQKILDEFPVLEFSGKLNPANNVPPKFNNDHGFPIIGSPLDYDEHAQNLTNNVDKVLVTFSVALPINDQIEKAKEFLREQQNSYKDQNDLPLYKGRVQSAPFINYLRYLDGIVSGATQTEIAHIVHPTADKKSAQQKVNKGLKAAEGYRDIGYLKILGI